MLLADLPVLEDALIAPPLDADTALPDVWPTPPGLLAALMSPGARTEAPAPKPPLQLEAPTAGSGSDTGGG